MDEYVRAVSLIYELFLPLVFSMPNDADADADADADVVIADYIIHSGIPSAFPTGCHCQPY